MIVSVADQREDKFQRGSRIRDLHIIRSRTAETKIDSMSICRKTLPWTTGDYQSLVDALIVKGPLSLTVKPRNKRQIAKLRGVEQKCLNLSRCHFINDQNWISASQTSYSNQSLDFELPKAITRTLKPLILNRIHERNGFPDFASRIAILA